MGLFVWDDIFSVGNELIDSQHKRLFDIGNRFHAALERRAPRIELMELFNELVEYTGKHFADEEQLMRDCRYADYDRHKTNHEKLVKQVLAYKHRLEGSEPEAERYAIDFIKTWLTCHVLGMDRNYSDCVAKVAM